MKTAISNLRPDRALVPLVIVFLLGCGVATETPAWTQNNAPENRAGEDWPQFLGPRETGVSGESGLLKSWPEQGPPLLWQVNVGTGYGAPSVRGDRAVLHHRMGDEELLECFDIRTGEKLWRDTAPSEFSDPFGYNNGPRCTPLLTETHCYAFGAEGRLTCVKLDDGQRVWMRETHKDFKIPDAFFGVGATPILEDGKLIVLVGGQPNSAVVAFSAETGETLWQNVGQKTWDGSPTGWPRPETYEWTGTEMMVSYSSPIAATLHGKRHVLCLLRQGLVSLDPETGAENFHYWFRSRDHESVNAARPVVIGNRIFLSAAYRVGSVLLEVQPDGKSVAEVWKDEEALQAHWSTPIIHEGYIYGFSGRHENGSLFRCLKLETGEVVWETTGWDRPVDGLVAASDSSVRNTTTGQIFPWPYYGRGSKILVDGQFIVLGERGTLALVKCSPESFQEICRFKPARMNYPCWAAPVLSRGRLFLRSEDTLLCYDLRDQTASKPQP
ncbi:MAG: PQQ-binding-like beta-propeller repeat protein [Planctomycetaceae bacterium]|nr:PQQ-binding-like beta-propeller repeat protein [Planctomycetaceae bacterium]